MKVVAAIGIWVLVLCWAEARYWKTKTEFSAQQMTVIRECERQHRTPMVRGDAVTC